MQYVGMTKEEREEAASPQINNSDWDQQDKTWLYSTTVSIAALSVISHTALMPAC